MSSLTLLTTFAACIAILFTVIPRSVLCVGKALGWQLRKRTQHRREWLIAQTASEYKESGRKDDDRSTIVEGGWEEVDDGRQPSEGRRPANSGSDQDAEPDQSFDGFVGFFHPFCNAGGGGERVLWAAIRATQIRWPKAIVVVYTGDHDVGKSAMLKRVQERFNITLSSPSIHFLYPTTRSYVLASSWPRFTLIGQSLGSVILGYDALSMLVPDVFVDTMGYSFACALTKFLCPDTAVGAYVHYPTISTDMLGSLDEDIGGGKGGIHAGKGKGWQGRARRIYWQTFARLYGWTGGWIDVVMTNSTWTQGHISQLWDPSRRKQRTARTKRMQEVAQKKTEEATSGTVPPASKQSDVEIVYPPCAVEELTRQVDVSSASESQRSKNCIYIAQFRSEKNHALILRAFSRLLSSLGSPSSPASSTPSQTSALPNKPTSGETYDTKKHPHLTLVGSVRDSTDETYIYSLRLLAHELKITHAVTFLLNASWDAILTQLRTASIGVNAMWNEHFGIGVVEYQAAGLISVVNDSGGPKWDICRPMEEDGEGGTGPTGFHASTEMEYADALKRALDLGPDEAVAMRQRARRSAQRFNEEAFERRWMDNMTRLVRMRMGL